ncbi:hypothetical protein CKM354_000818900 [Cercospora kikuchii]|uniref:BTB domain-containing protein n=1 Tax=Cercospora kikuchii TaxID=84275 RepID=A0A9P3CQY4_9PEZI|nr:uncharacterized protein CKM354_000818900 [Cercospora kikuchii]GIZ45005.1 hypothetical protein CKM354_000818900 [Cercospora kikuchii]
MDDFLRSLEGPTVLVKVGTGDGGRDFTVSRALLCQNSEWFRSALEGDRFKEGQTGVISLPEDSTRAFSSFHFYLLRRRMLFPVEKLEDGTVDAFADQLETCIETWTFANKYSMHTLKDTAMIAFCWHLQHATGNVIGLPAACLALCFSHTGEGSPLRQLAADYIVTRMKGKKSDAGELVGDLAPLQGFIQALNEAHQFHHDAEEGTSNHVRISDSLT